MPSSLEGFLGLYPRSAPVEADVAQKVIVHHGEHVALPRALLPEENGVNAAQRDGRDEGGEIQAPYRPP